LAQMYSESPTAVALVLKNLVIYFHISFNREELAPARI